MRYKRGQEWLRLAGRPSVFGQGLLDRARAISLALLGATAAVGLAIVALALNQSWPLVAGSSIPVIPSPHQAVGEATVAAGALPAGKVASASPADVARFAGRDSSTGREPGSGGSAQAPAPTASAELVVAPSSPAEPDTGGRQGSPQREPAPTVQQPQQVSQSSPEQPAAESPVTPASAPAPTTPPATTSEVPVDDSSSDPPSWSHGGGHAYGHDDDSDDDDSDGWSGHGHGGWHGHHDD